MDRVYESGASAIAPTPPAVPSTGFPSRGNPGTGTMPTVPGPYMMHSLVEEIMAVISAAGIAPDKAVLNQLKLALDSIYMSKNGTSALLQNFAGLTRSMTALGGGLVREYVDVTNAATVGGIEIGVVYNCAVNPVSGVWAGRDIADICWLEKWHDVAGTKEFWFAPTGAAGAVPAWVNVFTLNANNGNLSISGGMSAATLNGVTPKRFNDIVNGQFRVAQTGVSFASPANGAYDLDGWLNSNTSAAIFTVAQSAGSTAGKLQRTVTVTTADAAIAATDGVLQVTRIEGYNAVKYVGNTFTIGFKVRSSVAGIHCLCIYNGTSTYVAEYTINAANTLEYKTITIVGGTPVIANAANLWGMQISWVNMGGTAIQTTANSWNAGSFCNTVNQVNDMATIGNVFALEDVTLNLGTVAAVDDINIEDELRRCQRQYETGIAFIGVGDGSNIAVHPVSARFQVPKRAAPTIINSSSAALTPAATAYSINGGAGLTSCSLSATTVNELQTSTAVTVGTTAAYNYGAYFSASARL